MAKQNLEDDMKLEIAIMAEEQSLMQASHLARQYFPFHACNLVQAVKMTLAIYKECYGKDHKSAKNFEKY